MLVTPKVISKDNNFDVLRLLAALQVVFVHSASHFEAKLPKFFSIISYYSGVPIFFGISGFLITNAYYSNTNIKRYFTNRILRLYPGLLGCFVVTVTILLVFRVIDWRYMGSIQFFQWFFCQTTFFQFYTETRLRTWGVGAPNGSLWTIAVEIQFYILVPLLVYLIKKWKNKFLYLISAFVIVMSISLYAGHLLKVIGEDKLSGKLLHVSILPFFSYFLIGILSFFTWDWIKKWVDGKFLFWGSIHLLYTIVFSYILNLYQPSYYPNVFGFISNLLLWLSVISFAFSAPSFSRKFLKGNDISYGIYIYHMLVINSLIALKMQTCTPIEKMALAVSITIISAMLSWHFVEKPFLRKKSKIRYASDNPRS